MYLLWSLGLAHAAPLEPQSLERSRNLSIFGDSASVLLLIWSNVLTKADGNRCAFEPSCSAFAGQALSREGPIGVVVATDRILREAAAYNYARNQKTGFFGDPVSDHVGAWRLLSGGHCRPRRRLGAAVCT